jgi:predicted transcriptional regulator of viral defense system
MVAGRNTNNFGVEERAGPNSESLQVTNLERTLIDIVVRPAYAGGPSHILNSYRVAKDRIPVDGLLAILNKLD